MKAPLGKASPPRVVALVLTYNSGSQVLECLESLAACHFDGLEVLVVDNASTDDTVSLIRDRFPDLDVHVAPRNLGFGGGCNLGVEATARDGAQYVLLVNPDATVAPDMLGTLVAFMDAHETAGAVGPKTYSTEPMPDGSPRLLYAGAFRGRLPLRQRIPGIGQADSSPATEPLEVDYIWGHGMLLRVAAFEAVRGFDTDYFMYCEDLDLCVRLAREGYSLWCVPAAIMWHDAPDGARAIRSEAWRWRLKADGMAIFHRKHHGPLKGHCLSFCTALVETAQLLRHGHWRALRHQLVANLAHALGLGSKGKPAS